MPTAALFLEVVVRGYTFFCWKGVAVRSSVFCVSDMLPANQYKFNTVDLIDLIKYIS